MKRRLRDGRDGRALVEELERKGQALVADERCRWFLELGGICEFLVPERARALALYRQAWEADPAHVEALDRARTVAAELGRLREVVSITEIELQREKDESRAEQLAVLVVEALLDLGDRQGAAGFLMKAMARFPASMPLNDALGTVGHDDDWSGEVERLIDIGEETRNAEDRARVFLRAARVLHMSSPGDPRYETLLRRVLKDDPYNDSGRRLLEALLVDGKRWDDLEQLEQQTILAFPGAEEQAFFCERFAFAWCSRGDDARAVAYLWRAVERGGFVYPIAGLTLLRGIYAPRRQWRELLDAVDAVLETPMEEEATVHAALLAGTVAWRALDDVDRASGYFDRVRRVATDSILLVDFDDFVHERREPETLDEPQKSLFEAARRLGKSEPVDRVLEAFKRAIAADPSKRGPRRALARALHHAERWRALADALKDEEAHACRDDEARVRLLLQLTAVYRDRLRQDILAIQTLHRVLEIRPDHLAALDQLQQLHEAMSRWSELVATLQKKLEHVKDPAERVQLHLRLAQLQRERLMSEAESLRELAAALELDPSLDDVAAQLEQAYTRRREWDKLIALKRSRLDRCAPGERVALLVEVALLATEKLKKAAEAIAAWRAVLDAEPGHDAALASLERLYLVEKDHAQLANVIAQRAEHTFDLTQKAQVLQKLATVYADELAQPKQAIEVLRQVLMLQPTNARAQEQLRRLYLAERNWDELEKLFASLGRLDECVRLFERRAVEDEGPGRIVLLERVAMILRDALAKPSQAARAFEKLLALEPRHLAAAEALIPFYEQSREPRKLATVLTVQLEEGARDQRKPRLERLARVYAEELDERVTAFRCQLQAFEEDPADAACRQRLEALTRATSMWPLLVEAYQRALEPLSPADRVPLLAVIAEVLERELGDVDGATASWRAIVEIDGAHRPALDALERIYAGQRRFDELHHIYRKKLELAEGDEAKLDLLHKMARLAEDEGDDRRALAAYRGILDVSGDEPRALAALDRILERLGEWRELALVIDRELKLPTSTAEEKRRWKLRLGELMEMRLDDADTAQRLYREVLTEAPDHLEARQALERFLARPEHALATALFLSPLYRRAGAVEKWIAAEEIHVAHAQSNEEQIEVLHAIASAQAHELGQPQQAFDTLGRALRIAPADERTVEELEKLASTLGAFRPLVELYREVAVRPLSIDQHVDLRCRLARIYRDELKENDRAIATYSRVLDLRADHDGARAALEALLTVEKRFAELTERLRERVERAPDHPESPARWRKLGQILDGELDDPQAAIAAYARLLERHPDDQPAIAALERMFDAGRARAEAAALLEKRYRAAGNLAGLFHLLAAKFVQAPWPGGVGELDALARETGERARFVAALNEALATATPGVVVELRLHLSAIADDVRPAESHLRAALEVDDRNVASLAALDRLLAGAGRHDERVALLRRAIALGGPEAFERILQLASLQAETLGDLTGALASYRDALALRPDEPQALRGLARLEDDDAAERAWRALLERLPDDSEALAALAAHYERHERFADLAAVLDRQLAVAKGSALEPALAEQLALVAARLGDDERALAAWRRAAALSPGVPGPLREVARRLRNAGRTAELADALAELLRVPELPRDEAVRGAAELGELEGTVLGRTDRAVDAWRRALEADPGHRRALEALELLYAQSGRHEDAWSLVEARAQASLQAGDRADAIASFLQAAAGWLERGDPARALADYDRVLAVEPTHAQASAELEALLRARGDWAELAKRLAERAQHLVDETQKIETLRQLSLIEEKELNHPQAALDSLATAFELDGRWFVFDEDLRRLARATNNFASLTRRLEARLKRVEPTQQLDLLLTLGELDEERGDAQAALARYRAALALDGSAPAALDGVERALRKLGSPELFEVLQKRAESSLDREEQLRLYEALASEAARQGRWVRAVDVHRRCAELTGERERAGRHWYDAGVIYRDELASFDEALTCFQRALDTFADGAAPPALVEAHGRMLQRSRSRAQR